MLAVQEEESDAMLQGQSSRMKDPPLRSKYVDPCPPMFVNNVAHPPLPALDEPVQLSQYQLEHPHKKSVLPELDQCACMVSTRNT